MANHILSIIPQENKYLVTFDHSGPASYAQAAGDVINAADIGFGAFEYINVAGDSTKQWFVWPIFNLAIPPSAWGAAGDPGANATPSVQIHWYSFTTGSVGGQSQSANSEATAGTNLSTFAVRLQAMMI